MTDFPVPVHPLATIWPLMSDADLDGLADDIAAHGQRLPIIRVDGMILDGRNRWLACERAGITPWVEDIPSADQPEALDALAWSLNDHRRHANEGVRAMAAARRANMRQGERTDLVTTDTKSQSEMARQFGVSRESVSRATTVLAHGSAEVIAAVENGDIAVSLAAKTVRRLQETGEKITSIADLKKTMRQIYREDHPLIETQVSPPSREALPDHVGVDTFGVVRAIVRHAEQYSPEETAARIDKWTRLNILDDLPPAIDYLATLTKCLDKGE
jgi:ParB-like chromosome segregation protein Spo0J